MNYSGFRPTEECPLTKDSSCKYKLSTYCGGGLKFIISCFSVLTIAITTTLILQLLYADETPQDKAGVHGAVATDYTNCSQIGTKLLRKGGNAVDASVAAMVCMAVVAPHKTGLGGGGYIMIYNHKEKLNPLVIDFANNYAETGIFEKNGVRIPALLKGLEYAHAKKGKLPWNEVIEPSVILARQGFVVSKELASEVAKNSAFENLYQHLNAGDILKLNALADTLDTVAQHGTNVLYNGTLSRKILPNEIEILKQLKELEMYEPQVHEAKKSIFYDHVVYYPPSASSMPIMLSALENLRITTENTSTIETQVHVAQALIHSLSIPFPVKQNDERQRYTGVMAMDWEDTYVSILTGISAPFGLGYMSNAGFLLDKFDVFTNLSALVPIIFYNQRALCGLRGVFGTDDTFVVGQLLYNIILRGLNVSNAIEYPRYYYLSDGVAAESDEKHSVDVLIRTQLNSMISVSHMDANLILKSVNAIIKRKDLMSSHSDSRGGGLASRF